VQLFADWGVRHSALFTFPHSPRHIALCQEYGYWSQQLTAVMALPVVRQDLGDTVLVHEADALAGFAICHLGAGSEAGSGSAFVKFGAARPGNRVPERFDGLT
jgi:hypothetical protein